ncbi:MULTISPECIES: PLP-dependent cysteine synthase family protein [Heyndrickxia]|jgi:O-acetylserine dependent cystathionine beta-synthase|uniref:Pyridoxal-5'-phosphate-dependent protein beta subunit n=1 Tax=Heyndrickxia coagulans 36D1 TaxID=345219 RepID=G2TLR2_HEYCO|nr:MULTISPECIES: cysteine synthase family protein [Heyndrickxia]AEP01146.1 Pyridoxal-5'-phosphate-dependent protein beta subunit [Heyndrickxia coagulans 36D1]AVD57204.1 cysteine synthase family protein [Heyndrickxia coagulans]KYC72843.1 Cystathionine beta-synthase [Heyndrickxia coagulans]MBQ4911332.1 cysteine synthase family protein [Heyndrickxia faecalis]MCI1576738.1 cysteine synthase family protein [Heyndrickxia coagulans]
MKVAKSVHELIGNTPLVELTAFDLPKGVRLFAKLEYFNPGGSIKDRLGAYLVERAFREGKLKRGGTIIEPTAGNTGIGLALAAIRYGVHAVFVVPEKFSVEKQTLMRALGAEVVNTPTELGMEGAIAKAKKLVAETPNAYFPGQFENPSNPETYYKTLGPEIWEALDGHIDVFVAGAGSGGTFMGTARYLKEKNPGLKAAIVEPEGSILNGGEPRSHRTEGIGMEFLPPFMDRTFFDAIHTIPDDTAFKRLAEAARLEGLLIGSSSGAALEASLREAKQAKPGTHIVTIFPDSSERYLSRSIYS